MDIDKSLPESFLEVARNLSIFDEAAVMIQFLRIKACMYQLIAVANVIIAIENTLLFVQSNRSLPNCKVHPVVRFPRNSILPEMGMEVLGELALLRSPNIR